MEDSGGEVRSPRVPSELFPKGRSTLWDQEREAADKNLGSTSPSTCSGGACWCFWVVLLSFSTLEKEGEAPSRDNRWLWGYTGSDLVLVCSVSVST